MMPRRRGANSYANKVKMSREKYLLVEGRDDRHFFLCLARSLDVASRVRIEATPDQINIDPSQDNVREKIIEVEGLIRFKGEAVSSRFIGFVDRQFDGFCIKSSTIVDSHRSRHYGLVRSRGHSIENYLFEYPLMEDQLKRFYPYDDPGSYHEYALKYMRESFSEVVDIACAVSLAAWESELISKVAATLRTLNESTKTVDNWRIVSFKESDSPSVTLNKILLREHIESVNTDEATRRKTPQFLHRFDHYLNIVRSQENLDVSRWVCHGHIGMEMVRHVYAMFIFHFWELQGSEGDSPIDNIDNMMHSPWISMADDETNKWVDFLSRPTSNVSSPVRCFTDLEL